MSVVESRGGRNPEGDRPERAPRRGRPTPALAALAADLPVPGPGHGPGPASSPLSPLPDHTSRRQSAQRPSVIRRGWTVARTTLLVCADLVAANAAGSVALSTRFELKNLPASVSAASGPTITYQQISVLLALTWVVVLACVGAHHRRRFASLWDQSAAILRASVGLLAVIGIASLFARLQLSRSYVLVALGALLVFTFIGRAVVFTVFNLLMRIGILTDRVLLLGPRERVDEVRRHLERTSRRRVRIVAERIHEDGLRHRHGPDLEAELLTTVERQGLTSLIVCGPDSLPAGGLRSLSAALAGSGVSVVVAPGTTEALGPAVQIHPIGDLMLLRVRDSEPRLPERVAKHVMDRTVALLALVLGFPVLAAVAVAVALDGRPILFRQQRMGRGAKPFTIYKFRTMLPDAEDRLHRLGLYELYVANGYKLPAEQDPRITRTGAFLRRTSLDELPQLWNVLRGQMSLVGPRPVLEKELASYGKLLAAYTGVKPGLTGYWQINGRSDVGFPERAELDCYYFDHRSLRFDLRILARTFITVAFRRGAH